MVTKSKGLAADPRSGTVGNPLVTTSISSRDSLEFTGHGLKTKADDSLILYRSALKVKRYGYGNPNQKPPNRTGSTLQGFSTKSRSNLRFIAENSELPLVSQFGLTYHNEWPIDGRECKRHLRAWLKVVRRLFPGIGILWLLEFQKRDAPHFHVFLTVPPGNDSWEKLAESWVRITDPDNADQLWWHGPKRGDNWIPWEMATANYLTKYIDKDSQKHVPPGFSNFGRFWGNSKNIKPVPILEMPADQLNGCGVKDEKLGFYGGEKTVIRWLGRCDEKRTRGFSKFRSRAGKSSYSMRRGTPVFLQIAKYFDKLRLDQQFTHDKSKYEPVDPSHSPF